MNNYIFIIIILAIIIVILGAVLWLPKNTSPTTITPTPSPTPIDTNSQNNGIEVALPKANDVIKSPVTIKGKVTGNGWTGFEGQVGTVTLVDENGKELAKTFLPAITEWTSLPTEFATIITFDSQNAASGQLIFRNENASGEPSRDKTFILPIKFK